MVDGGYDVHAGEGTQTLRILLLGAPEVLWGGEAVCISRRQVRALLYRLAARQEPVSRDHLCFLFWPDTPDATARRCLTHLLTHLRLALPIPQLILFLGDAVQLNTACAWSDTVWLHELCCTRTADLNPELCWRTLDLIRGPFLEGFALPHCPEYELWVVQEQQHWHCQIARMVSRLASSRTILGEPALSWQPEPSDCDLVARGERFLAQAALRRLRIAPIVS